MSFTFCGLVILLIAGILRRLSLFPDVGIVLQSFLCWIIWVGGAFYFFYGAPSRETYFFDELNQCLVYQLNLPLNCSLEDVFRLAKENLDLSRERLNELDNRQSVNKYINELSEILIR